MDILHIEVSSLLSLRFSVERSILGWVTFNLAWVRFNRIFLLLALRFALRFFNPFGASLASVLGCAVTSFPFDYEVSCWLFKLWGFTIGLIFKNSQLCFLWYHFTSLLIALLSFFEDFREGFTSLKLGFFYTQSRRFFMYLIFFDIFIQGFLMSLWTHF